MDIPAHPVSCRFLNSAQHKEVYDDILGPSDFAPLKNGFHIFRVRLININLLTLVQAAAVLRRVADLYP